MPAKPVGLNGTVVAGFCKASYGYFTTEFRDYAFPCDETNTVEVVVHPWLSFTAEIVVWIPTRSNRLFWNSF